MSFQFKHFFIDDTACAMRVGTDSVLLGAWADVAEAQTVVDAGAGSGLLALMVAQRNPGARITAVEVDAGAAGACRANVAASPWPDRIATVCAEMDAYAPATPVDLIVSNPPFFTEDLRSPDAARARARHAGTLSPLALVEMAAAMLSQQGSLAMVTPAGYEDAVTFSVTLAGLCVSRLCAVSPRAGRPANRLLWQITRRQEPCRRTQLALRGADGDWSADYLELTADFYLHAPGAGASR